MNQEYLHDFERLQDEAAAWVARLSSDTLSNRDKRLFSEWLNLSTEHEKAFDEACEVWEVSAAAAFLPFAELEQTDRVHTDHHANTHTWYSNLPSWQVFALASVVCVATLIYTLFLTSPPASIPSYQYVTGPGEHKSIELPDGSVVELNTKSSLSVSYETAERHLTLHKGEAYFSVAPDKKRPFIVDVGLGNVTAVGTAFNIYRKPHETVVTVTEGIVDVREQKDATTPLPNIEKLHPAQQIRFDKRGLSQVSSSEVHKVMAWRDKVLIFDNMELPLAISELNRYLSQPVDATDSSLAGLRVSGTFSVDAPDATLEALMASFNIVTEKSSSSSPLYLRIE